MPLRVINPANHPITLYKNQKLETVEIARRVYSMRMPKDTTIKRTPDKDPIASLDLEDSHMTWSERDELKTLLKKYQHLFAHDETQLPGTTAIEHVINVTDVTPLRQKAYRVPASLRKALDDKLDTLLDAGIITPSCSPWASPLVLVKKPDNSIRPCVDYRKLNAVTVADSYPLPRVDESMECLSGAKYLTTLDLHSGFMQVPVAEESKQYTAFITSRGLFEFNYLPFGLRNAPATFSRLMQFVLSGLLFHSSILYMDDILVCSKTWKEHLQHLEEIFIRLDHNNLRLKLKKCTFGRGSLPFLGYLITTNGVSPDPDNVSRLQKLPSPTNTTETRSFLGLANYYRRFIPDFSNIARPLYNLIKKETRFQWTSDCQAAFDSLKQKLTTSPMLVYPHFDRPFCVSTDASNLGAGAVLSQVHEGQERPIAYFSHKFNGAESRYETVEQELYAVVLALKHWKHYLYGHLIHVYSDQRSLSWGIRQSDSPRMMKWVQQLAEFDVKIFYRAGRRNTPADFLSRLKPFPGAEMIYSSKEKEPAVQTLYNLHLGKCENDYFLQQQLSDPQLARMMDKLKDGKMDAETDRLKRNYCLLKETGCLMHRNDNGMDQFVVPQQLKPRILEEMHDSTWGAHLGIARTYEKVLQKYWWDGLKADVENWIQSCVGCSTRKNDTHPTHTEMQPILADAPW